MTIATTCQIGLQNGGINDPERVRGRKYHHSLANTFLAYER
jgi:hypothetical protein